MLAQIKRRVLVSKICVAILLLLLASWAYAYNSECILNAIHRLAQPELDSSVELELDTTDKVLNLLTTRDGKVGGLLHEGETLPTSFIDHVEKKQLTGGFPGIEPREIPWDDLQPFEKRLLLTSVSSMRMQRYSADRTFHGLAVRKEVLVKFDLPTDFLGHSYPAGVHAIDISSVLGGKVELRAPNEVENVKGIELHFRANQTSGAISNEAWKLLDGLGIPRNHQHVHIVSQLPMEALVKDPEVEPALIGDFYRRTNLAAEMRSVVAYGSSIRSIRDSSTTYFDSLSPARLRGVIKYFHDVASGRNPAIGDTYKMAWVGMRGSDKYDKPGLWGLEVRAISAYHNPSGVKTFLNGIQYEMTTGNYGMTRDTFAKWLNAPAQLGRSAAENVTKAWYNQNMDVLLKEAPPEVRKQLGGLLGWHKRASLSKKSIDAREIKMLVHDWRNDPLVFNNPHLSAEIISAQITGLKEIQKGRSVNEATRRFLINSGLYKEVMKSVGVSLEYAY